MAEIKAKAQPQQNKAPADVKKSAVNKIPPGVKHEKRRRISVAWILCILIVLLDVAFAGLLYFDIGGIKKVVVPFFKIDIPTDAQIADADAKLVELTQKQASVDSAVREQEKAAKAWETTVAEREAAVAGREAAAQTKEQELTDKENALNGQEQELQAMVQMFESMSPDKAAAAIAGIKDKESIVRLLSHMNADKAALILNNMEAETATTILNEMLKQQN